MKEQFLFYDKKYGVIKTTHKEYLIEKMQYNKAGDCQTCVATLSIFLSLVSILVSYLGVYSTNAILFKVLALSFLGLSWGLAVVTIYLSNYIEAKNYIEHFRLTKEYKEQIKNR